MPVLKQLLPRETLKRGFDCAAARELHEVPVIGMRRTDPPCDRPSQLYAPWPGSELYVQTWYILENGKAVGINNDPVTGISLPVIDYQL